MAFHQLHLFSTAWAAATKDREQQDTLKHIVERVVAGVKSIISTTSARLPADLSSELLGLREAATSPR